MARSADHMYTRTLGHNETSCDKNARSCDCKENGAYIGTFLRSLWHFVLILIHFLFCFHLQRFMDQCVSKEGNPDSEDYKVSFFFKFKLNSSSA